MDAKKCDLCGAFYEPHSPVTFIEDFAQAIKNALCGGNITAIRDFFELKLDLYTECSDALCEFLKSRQRKGDNNAESL